MDKTTDRPADLDRCRVQREETEREQRHRGVSQAFSRNAPDYGREIPPRINPDTSHMVSQVTSCMADLTVLMGVFQQEVSGLAQTGRLAPRELTELMAHYEPLQVAVVSAAEHAARWDPAGSGDEESAFAHALADHAKYVYAVGSRDIAALQYRLPELAHTNHLDFELNERLQWGHCLKIWELLYHGTTCAVRDDRTWDGGWEWSDNTYSDGRQIMTQARIKNWQVLDRNWPYNSKMCGDGAINEHPVGSICHIAPVHDPDHPFQYHAVVEIDLDGLLSRLEPTMRDPNSPDEAAAATHDRTRCRTRNSLCI